MGLSIEKLGVIGSGVIGSALIRGLLQSGLLKTDQIWGTARTEATCQKIRDTLGISARTDYKKELSGTQVLLLCTKPASVYKVIETLKSAALDPNTLIISTLAGISLSDIEGHLGQENPVIRAMPNTPCIIGKGMTIVASGTHATQAHLDMALGIFKAVGDCMELEESHFNAITSLNGSGPAYFYLMMEALADGGVRVGLPREVALKIVTQVALGSAMMVQQTGRHPAALRDDVTTPAGCTIGGLLMMEDGKIRSVLARAVEEATHIAGALGHPATD